MKAETRPEGNKNYRGNKGPLYISDLTSPHPVTKLFVETAHGIGCLLYTSPSPRDRTRSRMPSSA